MIIVNEEKTNNAAQQTENPVTTPVEEKTSTTEVSTAAPEAKQVAVATEDKASTQAPAAPVAEKTVQPANEAVPQPQVTPQPASEPAPKPQVVPQPAQEATPAPTPTVNKNDSIIPEVAPQEVAPAAPAGETIKPAPA